MLSTALKCKDAEHTIIASGEATQSLDELNDTTRVSTPIAKAEFKQSFG